MPDLQFPMIDMDNLCGECGYFNRHAQVNNGYGCDHPEQSEVERGQGKCYGFSCPIGSELHPSDEPLDAEEMRARGCDPESMSDGFWLIVYGPYKSTLRKAPVGIRHNRHDLKRARRRALRPEAREVA